VGKIEREKEKVKNAIKRVRIRANILLE